MNHQNAFRETTRVWFGRENWCTSRASAGIKIHIAARFTRVSRYTSWECEAAVMWNMIYRRVEYVTIHQWTRSRLESPEPPKKKIILICDDLFLILLINGSSAIDSYCVNRDNFYLLFMKYWNFLKNNKIRIYLEINGKLKKNINVWHDYTLKIWALDRMVYRTIATASCYRAKCANIISC